MRYVVPFAFLVLLFLYSWLLFMSAMLHIRQLSIADGSERQTQTSRLENVRLSPKPSCTTKALTSEQIAITWWLEEVGILQPESSARAGSVLLEDSISEQPIFQRNLLRQALRHFFSPKLSPANRISLIGTTKVCLEIVEKVGLPYFIYGGTLIGYLRHNNSFIPWDDDVDIALLTESEEEYKSYVSKLKNAIKAYPSHGIVYVESQERIKCFGILENNSLPITNPQRQWRWPFVDLQFMRSIKLFPDDTIPLNSNRNKITLIQDVSNSDFHYLKNMIYPLRRAYFSEGNIKVYVPNSVKDILAANYDISYCRSTSDYNHRIEQPATHIVTVACNELADFINFTSLN